MMMSKPRELWFVKISVVLGSQSAGFDATWSQMPHAVNITLVLLNPT